MSKSVQRWLKENFGPLGVKACDSVESLSPEDRAFCEAYVKTGNPNKAATQSGHKGPNPALLLHVPKISAYVNLVAAKQEHDLGRASAKELLERIKSAPLLAEDDTVLPPELMKEISDQLSEDELAVMTADEDTLLGNIEDAGDIDLGILQVPPVKMLINQNFGPEWILEQLVRVAERALQIEPVYDRKGRPIGTFTFQAGAALKALELLGKTMAMFKERVDIGAMDSMTPTDVDKRILALTTEHPELVTLLSNGKSTESNRQH